MEIAEVLSGLGATVSDTARPELPMQEVHNAYQGLVMAVTQSSIPQADYDQNVEIAKSLAAGDMSQGAIWARAAVQSHRVWKEHDWVRNNARLQWRKFFQDWDIVVCPIMANSAFKHNHGPMEDRAMMVNGAERPYWEQVFWAGVASLPGLPASAFPAGLSKSGLPIGFQAIGAAYNDRTTIHFASLLAKEIGGFTPPPAFAHTE